MIENTDNPKYASDEYCECENVIHTDGAFEIHICPECDRSIFPCNVCPDITRCDNCPAKLK